MPSFYQSGYLSTWTLRLARSLLLVANLPLFMETRRVSLRAGRYAGAMAVTATLAT